MRIAHLISQTVLGGAESYGFTLASELAARGHVVRLLANRANGPLFERSRPSGLEVRALPRTNRLDPSIFRFFARELDGFRPDIVHAHNFGANTWARAWGLLHSRIGIVCHIHSGRMVTSQAPHRREIDRLLFRRADAVIVLNKEQVDYVATRLDLPRERILLLPNGIDMVRFAPPAPGERNPLDAVCVASLTPVKNHEGLLRAFAAARVRAPSARLTLVGDGELRGTLEALARTLGIEDSVTFAGLQPDVLPYLRRAGVFVLASHREAMPLALLEAMASGMAAVASAVGAIPEMIEDDVNGVLSPADDVAALGAHIGDLLVDPVAQARLGRAARETVVNRYSLRASVDQLERLYEAIVARRSRRAR